MLIGSCSPEAKRFQVTFSRSPFRPEMSQTSPSKVTARGFVESAIGTGAPSPLTRRPERTRCVASRRRCHARFRSDFAGRAARRQAGGVAGIGPGPFAGALLADFGADVIRIEEESFNRTLDKGIALFEDEASKLKAGGVISGAIAFRLYDEQGFPLDLTQLMARERGLTVDGAGFEKLMEEQRNRARAAQKKEIITLSDIGSDHPTAFVGYDALATQAKIAQVAKIKDRAAVILDKSPCYAEMGGQVGDAGQLILGANTFPISATTKVGNTWLHFLEGEETPAVDSTVRLVVDAPRRHAIERHHTVTHILHWALHEVVSQDATQKGSNVTPDKLTFDFNSAALTAAQLADIEKLVNERIVANDIVSWTEVPYTDAKANSGIMQLFGEKYPENVRVVQIGGKAHALDGFLWCIHSSGSNGTATRN